MRYDMTPYERDSFIQITANEGYALIRGTSEEHLQAFREKMDFVVAVKKRYGIDKDAGINIIIDSGVILTNE